MSSDYRFLTEWRVPGTIAEVTDVLRDGRTLPDWKDGQVVWLTPAEVFARYGLDENGREPASAPRPSA